MEIDKQKLKKRIEEIREALSEVSRITSLSDKEFWADKEHLAAVKYYLLQAIEAVGSICLHILAKKYLKGVSVFGECFEELEKAGLLDKKTSGQLKRMVRFRNLLIHKYWEVDDKKVLQYSRENLGDIEEFIKLIKKEILS